MSPSPPAWLPCVLASANPDKAREIAEIVGAEAGLPLTTRPVEVGGAVAGFVLDLPERVDATVAALPTPARAPDVAETGATLEDNARIKARAVAAAFGLTALADDTGLEVDALDGAPGVRSARFAGEQATYAANVARLLADLDAAPTAPRGAEARASDRTARFATVALACRPDGTEVVARGEIEGVIAAEPRGQGGFGYDCVFVPVEGDGRTFAEMTAAEKHALSHRGLALRALVRALGSGSVR